MNLDEILLPLENLELELELLVKTKDLTSIRAYLKEIRANIVELHSDYLDVKY